MAAMKIAPGSIVRIDYEIRVKGGDVIESSASSGPVQYVHGEGKLLPALEKRLLGLDAGASLSGDIPASEVLPPEDTLPTRTFPLAELPKGSPLEVGAMFEAKTATGGVVDLRIVSIDKDHVTARLLPPLAGKDLSFTVRVMRIEDPKSHAIATVPPPLPAEALNLELEQADD
jgi:FKBP-type peptidyl-prolyl cis-trans isomerase SlyD